MANYVCTMYVCREVAFDIGNVTTMASSRRLLLGQYIEQLFISDLL